MKVVFIGQIELTARVAALSHLLAAEGHEVSVVGAEPHVSPYVRRLASAHVRCLPSFNPDKPGGWLYVLLSIWHAFKRQPDVVHIHTWKAGVLAYLIAMAVPEATLVWTVDAIPAWPGWVVRGVVRAAARIFDVITVPRRDVQYQLLETAGVRAAYVPDGYTPRATGTLSPRRFGVWPGRYCVATVSNEMQAQFVRQAFKAAGSKRALLILNPDTRPRVAAALFRQAAAILLFGANDTAETVLSAMASDTPIVAAAWPFYEEILGVTARYVKMEDREELGKTVREALRSKAPAYAKASAGKSAGRAEKHFRWERILADYLPLYRPAGKLVPVDSANFRQSYSQQAV